MIKVQGKIPRAVGVAVSGGVDSMAVLDFLSKNHDVTVYCFDHGTEYGSEAMKLVAAYCRKKRIPIKTAKILNEKPKGRSQEEHWRDERYAWFESIEQEIVMAHHLNDCVETWVFNMCNGATHTIPYRHNNVIRPFRLTTKRALLDWADEHKVPYLEDKSNKDLKYTRNYIRYELMERIAHVNPGLPKVIKKKLMEEDIN
jgi:tRNA(Ile)-lysidine synthase